MTKAVKMTLVTGAALIGVYALLRLGFYLSNHEYFEGAPAADIRAAFLHGLRFDLSGLVMLNLPVLVLFHLPLPTIKPRSYKRVVFAVFALVNTVGFTLNIVDFGYYPNVQRRTLFEPLNRPADVLAGMPGWLEEYPWLVLGGIAALLVLLVLMAAFVRRLDRAFTETPGRVRSHAWALVLILLGALAIRGGMQPGIMRPADAFVHSTSNAVGNLTLNSTYTVILSSFLPRFRSIRKMPDDEAARLVQGMVVQPGEELLDERFPLLRRTAPPGERRPWNIVLLIQESWTGAHVGPDAQGDSRTPFFDELARDGALFTNFLATGQRSSEAVPSIVASLPSLFRRPLIGSQAEMSRFRGLGDILAPHGYHVSFHHGAAPTMEGFEGFTGRVGFRTHYSRDDYRGPEEDARDGKWGIYDEPFYLDAARRMDEEPGPFATVVFGLTPHDPYRLPPNREHLFPPVEEPTTLQRYLRMLRYSDYALRRFFEYARTRPWFDRTLFLITADHTRFAPPESLYETFRVPLLIYAPGLVEPQVRPEIGSHPDILPTILDLLRIPTRHASLGRSLFDRTRTRHAVVQSAGRFLLFTDRFALVNDLRRDVGLFEYRADGGFQTDLSREHPDEVDRLRTRLFAYLQVATTAVVEDRLFPNGAP